MVGDGKKYLYEKSYIIGMSMGCGRTSKEFGFRRKKNEKKNMKRERLKIRRRSGQKGEVMVKHWSV